MELKKVVLIAAFCLCAVQARPEVTETLEDFESEFGVLIDPSHVDEEAANLKAAEDQINAENAKFASGEATYGEKLNDFSDLSKTQFEKEKEGLVMPDDSSRFVGDRENGIFMPPEELRSTPENDANLKALYEEINRQSVPDSVDGVSLGLVTPAKNQMSCGSCAAFAANGLHESCMLKAGAKKDGLDLSEQYLVDCGFNGGSMNACNGAYPHSYPDWFAKAGAGTAPHEANMPYLDRNPKKTCPTTVQKWGSGAAVTTAVFDYSCNADKLKQLVATQGAVLAGLYASDSGFSNYATGVFQGCSSKSANHAILVVGYGTENGVDYWLVKNSWGDKWGANGFIKVKRGANECGIENVCVAATCAASGSADPAPTTPAPPPIPPNLFCDISNLFGSSQITGNYNLRIWSANGVIESKVKCENSSCTPRVAGPSNACMYICGKTAC